MVAKRKQAGKAAWLKELLAREPDIAVEAAYLAGAAIYEHRQVGGESTNDARALALQIVSEIEAREGIPHADFTKQQTWFYINSLVTAVLALTAEERALSPGRGKRLLAKLRAQRPPVSRPLENRWS